jgi:phosphoglycerate kinase
MTPFLTLDDVNVTHQNVLVRVDFNLPMKSGVVSDDTRIERALPTIVELIDRHARVILMSHFGRPGGKHVPEESLKPLVSVLSEKLGRPVVFVEDILESNVLNRLSALPWGSVVLLENLRFYPGEEANDPGFSQDLAQLGTIYVNEAFSCSHRSHASVVGITSYLQAVAGRGVQMELEALERALVNPERPLAAIVAGAKISTKLDLLDNLLEKVDHLIIGGAMANTFLFAEGYPVGESLYEPEMMKTAAHVLTHAEKLNCNIVLPLDVVVTEEIKPGAASRVVENRDVGSGDKIVDLGPRSVALIEDILNRCKTVVWNGPLGIFEIAPFDQGTVTIAHYLANATRQGRLQTYAGGGDTLAALSHAGCLQDLTYVSTAGGAFLEWLEGKTLPGIAALMGAQA